MRIGEVARDAGVRVDTVRYYERERLLSPVDRRPSGYREFTEDAVRRIRFIRRAQELGFTLREIRELLELRMEAGASCGDVRERAEEKLEAVEEKLRDLRAIESTLRSLISACEDSRPVGECPILESLDEDSPEKPGR